MIAGNQRDRVNVLAAADTGPAARLTVAANAGQDGRRIERERAMPDFAIVDSHVHLYDPTWLRYGWLAKRAQINRRYDLADFDRCRARSRSTSWSSPRSRSMRACTSPKPAGSRGWRTRTRDLPG